MRGGGKCARRVLCSPERESGRRKEAGGGGGSLFSASLCLPFHCCWRRFLYLCVMLDYWWLFNIRAWKACHFLGRFSLINLEKDEKGGRDSSLSHSVNLAINHVLRRAHICAWILRFLYLWHICKPLWLLNINFETNNASSRGCTVSHVATKHDVLNFSSPNTLIEGEIRMEVAWKILAGR